MPLMRAKFERCGEPIPMRVDKRDYLFQENHAGDFVANIDSEEHAHYLEDTGNFELYTPPTYEEMMAREKEKVDAKTRDQTKRGDSQKSSELPVKGKNTPVETKETQKASI